MSHTRDDIIIEGERKHWRRILEYPGVAEHFSDGERQELERVFRDGHLTTRETGFLIAMYARYLLTAAA